MFRELLEAKPLYAWITDPSGNERRVSSNMTMTNERGLSLAITNLQYLLSKADVTKETGNSGTKHYHQYMKTRWDEVVKKSKNNKDFAKNLNKAFGITKFTDKELF